MSSKADPRVGGRFGKYEIVRLLGRGGMGVVYEARDTEKGRTVALKILVDHYSKDTSYRRRFTREAHAAAQLQEPHVIPIHDWGEIDGSLYIDMRLVRGTDLRKLLDAGPLSPARAVSIISQVAAALDAAHAEKLMHRDVKPENIVVTADDFAYLVDFGIAERTGDTHLTQTGLTVGSMAYIAPERLSSQPTTYASDVYSLACVLYEMLTGRSPFSTTSAEQLLTAHLYTPPPRPSAVSSSVSPVFDEVVARGMAKEPDDRYGSAGAFARAASRALSGRSGTGPIAPLSAPTQIAPQQPAAFPTQIAPTAPPGYPTQIAPTGPTAAMAPPPAQYPQQPQHYPQQPPHYPQQGPPYPQQQGPERRSWLVPTVLAVCAALLLCVVGVTVVMLTDSDGATTSSQGSTTNRSDSGNSGGTAERTEDDSSTAATTSRTTTTTTTRPLALPPIVTGPDANNESCDNGITHASATGFGSRSARGTTATTCFFARNVLNAYWAAGTPSSAPRTISAMGAVSCQQTQGSCNGDAFVMQCQTYGTDDWITCTGGSNAKVFIY